MTRLRRSLLVPALLIAAWTLAAFVGWPSRRALPTPSLFVTSAAHELAQGRIWLDVLATLLRVLGALAIAVPLGGLLGIALGRRRAAWRAVEPSLDFLRAVPPILTFPLFLLALGYGEPSRLACTASAATGLVMLHVGVALSRAPRERAEMVALAGLSARETFFVLHVYEALPGLVTGTRVALAAALVVSVVSEMLVGAEHGLGARALDAMLGYRAELLWLVIALAGAIGGALSGALAALERRYLDW
jgi:sulfonate transport system permease protein